jgi:hypothetical protein
MRWTGMNLSMQTTKGRPKTDGLMTSSDLAPSVLKPARYT